MNLEKKIDMVFNDVIGGFYNLLICNNDIEEFKGYNLKSLENFRDYIYDDLVKQYEEIKFEGTEKIKKIIMNKLIIDKDMKEILDVMLMLKEKEIEELEKNRKEFNQKLKDIYGVSHSYWSLEFEKKVYGVGEREIEILLENGKVYAGDIENISEEIDKLKNLGYICYYKDEYLILDEIDKHYVIRGNKDYSESEMDNGEKFECEFEGTIYDFLQMQRFSGVSEEDEDIFITIDDINDFSNIITNNYFGDDYFYSEVTVEEYEKIKEIDYHF